MKNGNVVGCGLTVEDLTAGLPKDDVHVRAIKYSEHALLKAANLERSDVSKESY